MAEGWIGVDLDGTLARYDNWNKGRIGAPIPEMVNRVKRWLAEGREVRIVTARVGKPDPTRVSNTLDKIEEMREEIEDWCEEHIGQRLEVTNEKDYNMLELWDDRAIRVETNTGRCVRYEEDPRTEEEKRADEEVLDLFEKGKFLFVDPTVEKKAIEHVQKMHSLREEIKRLRAEVCKSCKASNPQNDPCNPHCEFLGSNNVSSNHDDSMRHRRDDSV